ncbi:MAG: c-type cytochrome [Geminicoccaceae bacterium]
MTPRVFACLACALGCLAVTLAIAVEAVAAIKYRKGVMQGVGSNTNGLAMIVKDEVEFTDHMETRAQALALAANVALAAFEQNTDGEGGEETTAKADIWSDWDDFKSKMEAMSAEADKLVEVAASGDTGAVGGQLGELGKTCKACHDDYRTK